MADREKVIDGLNETISYLRLKTGSVVDRCIQHQYDALELLKAHILTREEIEAWDGYTWEEYSDSAILQVTLIRKQFVRERLEQPYHISELNWAAYGKEWRLWSAQPTEEQRKVMKWDNEL